MQMGVEPSQFFFFLDPSLYNSWYRVQEEEKKKKKKKKKKKTIFI